MTWLSNNIGARVYLALVISIIFILFVGGCNGGSNPVAPAPIGQIHIEAPNEHTSWYVDGIAVAIWEVFSVAPIDHYRVYLSNDDSSHWVEIATGHISLEDNNRVVFHWAIPVDFEPGNYYLRIKGYSDNLLVAETTSPSFLIQRFEVEYGPVASFAIDVPDQIVSSLDFMMTVTAKDIDDNVVMDYNSVIYLFCGTIADEFGMYYIGCTIGDGLTTGIWSNGEVSHYGFSECFLGMTPDTTYYLSVGTTMDNPLPGFAEVLYVDNLE